MRVAEEIAPKVLGNGFDQGFLVQRGTCMIQVGGF